MKIDLCDAEFPVSPLRAEVCIIGAGIAGLVLARALIRRGVDILLLEAGGLEPAGLVDLSHPQQHSPAVEMLADPHAGSLEGSPRTLGGSSLTWGGQLLPLPSSEPQVEGASAARAFGDESEADVPSGPEARWPVRAQELKPFQAEAEHLLGVNALPYDDASFFEAIRTPAPHFSATGLTARLSKFAPFTHRNLAQTLGRELLAHPNARVLLHASVIELRLAPDSSLTRLHCVLLRAPSGKPILAEAQHFVLAAGTIETVRLLLASRSQQTAGLGNTHGQVGRNVHDHLTLTAATFTGDARARMLSELRPWVFPGSAGPVLHSLKLESSPIPDRRWPGPPVMAHLTIEEPPGSGIDAVRTLLHARQQHGPIHVSIRDLLPRLPGVLRSSAQLTWSARVQHRRFVSPEAAVSLRFNAAQSTPSDSRITLSTLTSSFGEPLPALRWIVSPEDCSTFRAFAALLLRDTGLREFNPTDVVWVPQLLSEPADDPDDAGVKSLLTDARHLMGGAIMGTNPNSSVVDPDLQVHGLPNLHIASLATFPDGRAQLPTLTLMELSLRLADRLATCLGR